MNWRMYQFVADPAWASQGPTAETSQFIQFSSEEIALGGDWYAFELQYVVPAAAPAVPIAANPFAPPPVPIAPARPEPQVHWILNRGPEVLRVPTLPVLVPVLTQPAFLAGIQWALQMLVQRIPVQEPLTHGILCLGEEPDPPPGQATRRLWLGVAVR